MAASDTATTTSAACRPSTHSLARAPVKRHRRQGDAAPAPNSAKAHQMSPVGVPGSSRRRAFAGAVLVGLGAVVTSVLLQTKKARPAITGKLAADVA